MWSGTEFPSRALDKRQWLRLFAAAGSTIDGKPAGRPAAPVRLWRGCAARWRYGFAWTADLEEALFCARRLSGPDFQQARVYEADVPPDRPLCIPGTAARWSEAEYVVNPAELALTVVDREEATR